MSDDPVTNNALRIGYWCLGILAVAASVVIGYFFIALMLTNPFVAIVLIVLAVGFGALVFGVVRERIQEAKNDKYRDVEP